MTTTAPSADAPRLTDEDTLREDVARAIAEEWGHARAKVTMNPGTPFVVPFHEMTTAAIATAEPLLRARHRAELLAEIHRLIDLGFEEEEQITPPIVYGYAPNGEMLVHIDRIYELLQADATRPVEGRGDR